MDNKILNVKKLIEKYDIPVFKKQMATYKKYNIKPSMAVILTSEDSGSRSYLRGICNFCNDWGIEVKDYVTASSNELEELIATLNKSEIHGIMIMYPTGYGIKDTYFMNCVDFTKDLEGLHNCHLGYLVQYEKFRDKKQLRKLIIPPTPKGIMYLFKRNYHYYEEYFNEKGFYPEKSENNPFEIEGKRITIINDSLAVGRSLALMMLNENGSVQDCHEYTPFEDVCNFVKASDFVISAVPSSKFIIPNEALCKDSIVVDISFEGNFSYPDVFNYVKKIAPRWDLVEKGNRINDMTLYRLISNLFYQVNSTLDDSVLREINEEVDKLTSRFS
jgi:5,10-methylene-tetrahydrofolate dehydrogenase/methenyl tetrahydrofolate cyclohydrolase